MQNGADVSEDCLYLNVWTPEWPPQSRKPVMLWIHGGGNFAGASSEAIFDGENFARRGVILVSANYRLGVFGFFAHPELTDESTHHASGNYGLMDQVAALKWVRDNIANFGGDPRNVTIFGQSGGGGKVNTLMAMPAAKGLFHRAAVQSGSLLNASTREDSAKLGAALVQQLGLSASQIDRIRELPAEQLVSAGIAAVRSLASPSRPGGPFRLPRFGW